MLFGRGLVSCGSSLKGIGSGTDVRSQRIGLNGRWGGSVFLEHGCRRKRDGMDDLLCYLACVLFGVCRRWVSLPRMTREYSIWIELEGAGAGALKVGRLDLCDG